MFGPSMNTTGREVKAAKVRLMLVVEWLGPNGVTHALEICKSFPGDRFQQGEVESFHRLVRESGLWKG